MAQVQVKDGLGALTTAALVTNTGQTTMVNSLPVTFASDQSPLSVHDATTDTNTTGTLTGGSPTLEIDTNAIYNTAIEITGTWAGVVVFEYTPDASSPIWYPLRVFTQGGDTGTVASTSANGVFFATTGGMQKIRANFSVATSGTVNVVFNASIAQQALTVSNLSENIWTCSFANTNASALSCDQFRQIYKSAGVTLSQASGNLAVVASNVANEEWLAVSTRSWNGAFNARYKAILSQRIAQNNFVVTLADKIGEGLTLTVNSATSVTVAGVPGTWTSENVGQFMNIGAVGGLAGMTPGRWAIASVSGSDLTFTVTAMGISSGSTTCTLFGWNSYRCLYDSTSATSAKVDAQRKGWASGDTTATINTTASPGHTGMFDVRGRDFIYNDSVVASSTAPRFLTKASRYENLPDQDVQLFLFLWSFNGTSAPASATTWTIGFTAVESYPKNPVFLAGINQPGSAIALPVAGTLTTEGLFPVGGHTPIGSLAIANPILMGGVDSSTQIKRLQTDPLGALQIVGAGESVTQFSLSAASGTPADGTVSKIIIAPRVESDFLIGFASIGSSTGFQVEYSYDNITYTTMPVARIDNNAISQQIGALYSPFVPVAGSVWRGKTYGAPYIRIHNMSGGGTPTGLVRIVPIGAAQIDQSSVSAWTFSTAGIIEAAGTANGTAAIGTMRTMQIPVKGSMKARLNIDAMMSTGQSIVLEGSVDGTNYTSTLQLAPLSGGSLVTACLSGASTTTAQPTIGVFESDVSGFASVRARMALSGAGTSTNGVSSYAHGALKLIPVQSNRLSVGVTTSAVTSFTTTFPAVSMAVAANPNRRLVVLKNEGAGTLYYGFGSATSALTSTSYTDIVAPGDSAWLANINQQVNISFGAAGTARVTELM